MVQVLLFGVECVLEVRIILVHDLVDLDCALLSESVLEDDVHVVVEQSPNLAIHSFRTFRQEVNNGPREERRADEDVLLISQIEEFQKRHEDARVEDEEVFL